MSKPANNPSLDSAIDGYLRTVARKWADSTLQRRRSDISLFARWAEENGHELESIDVFDIETYLMSLKDRGLAQRSRTNHFETIKGFFEWIEKRDYLTNWENPVNTVDAPKHPKHPKKKQENRGTPHITAEEKDLLLEHVPKPKLRNELIIRLLFQTGVRQGELANIKLRDVHPDTTHIDIYGRKNEDFRKVYFRSELKPLLSIWIDEHRHSYMPAENSPYMLVTYQAERIKLGRINEIIKEAAESAGIQEVLYKNAAGKNQYKVTTHALRHSHAIQSLNNGVDLRVLQEHLGHADISMTEKYLDDIDFIVEKTMRERGPGTEIDYMETSVSF